MIADQEQSLRTLRELIEARYGLAYPDQQLPVLAARLKRVLPLLGVCSIAEVHGLLRHEPEVALPKLISALTIGETYFMRNRTQFEALSQRALPELAKRLEPGSPLVIWSAGCATGEEAYSLAMWMREHAANFWPDRLRIVATDINASFLAKAKAGRYGERSLRQLEDTWRRRYFSVDGDALVIDESLRNVVHFQEHNLFSGSLPRGITARRTALVFCRNVLIYFSTRTSPRVLALFHQALMPDGVLMLGHAEPLTKLSHWRTEYYPGTFFYLPLSTERRSTNRSTPAAIVDRPTEKIRSSLGSTSAGIRARAKTRPVPKRLAGEPAKSRLPKGSIEMSSADLLEAARKEADTGNPKRAHDLLAELTARDKTSIEGHFLSALVAEQLGDWHAVRSALKKVLFLDKRLVLGHYLLAVLDEREGKRKAALRRYRTVCRLLKRTAEEVELPFGDGLVAGRLRELASARYVELTSVA